MSEKNLASVFQSCVENSPSIVFFDEIDALFSSKSDHCRKILAQLLIEIDSCSNVAIIMATNHPQKLDPRLLRSGRIDLHYLIENPNFDERKKFFLEKFTPDFADFAASNTNDFCYADLCSLVKNANLSKQLDNSDLRKCHLELALQKVKPSIDLATWQRYKSMKFSKFN